MGKRKKLWITRVILTMALAGAMLAVWPGYAVYDTYVSNTNSYGCLLTEPLSDKGSFAQYFVPQWRWLHTIELAVQYNEEAARGQSLRFELCRGSGECIYEEEIPLERIPNGGYFGIEVDRHLQAGEEYYWSIAAPQDADSRLVVMYTDTEAYQAAENEYITWNGVGYGTGSSQSVSQYIYRLHPDRAEILGKYWTFFILVWIVCMEVADRHR